MLGYISEIMLILLYNNVNEILVLKTMSSGGPPDTKAGSNIMKSAPCSQCMHMFIRAFLAKFHLLCNTNMIACLLCTLIITLC